MLGVWAGSPPGAQDPGRPLGPRRHTDGGALRHTEGGALGQHLSHASHCGLVEASQHLAEIYHAFKRRWAFLKKVTVHSEPLQRQAELGPRQLGHPHPPRPTDTQQALTGTGRGQHGQGTSVLAVLLVPTHKLLLALQDAQVRSYGRVEHVVHPCREGRLAQWPRAWYLPSSPLQGRQACPAAPCPVPSLL